MKYKYVVRAHGKFSNTRHNRGQYRFYFAAWLRKVYSKSVLGDCFRVWIEKSSYKKPNLEKQILDIIKELRKYTGSCQ